MSVTTDDLRIQETQELISPEELIAVLPVSETVSDTVSIARRSIHKILTGEDDRLSSNPKNGQIMRPGIDGPIFCPSKDGPCSQALKWKGPCLPGQISKKWSKGHFCLDTNIITSTRPLLRDLLFSLSMLEILE